MYNEQTSINLRKGSLEEAYTQLNSLQQRKRDVVMSANELTFADGQLITPNGYVLNGTKNFHSQVAAKLRVPKKYYDRMLHGSDKDLRLLDKNVNHWLQTEGNKYMFRTILDDPKASTGIVRALLSNRYRIVDNIDVMTIVLETVKNKGVKCDVTQCDVTDDRMHLRLDFPELMTKSSKLLKGYRTPRGDQDNDNVSTRIIISNSETGQGSVSITPQMLVEICKNGWTGYRDVVRKRHLGAELDEGVVQWSAGTQNQNKKLIVSQLSDALDVYLNMEYLESRVAEMENGARELDDPTGEIEVVTREFGLTDDERNNIMNHFLKGGDTTNFGVGQAITWEAHEAETAERQEYLEETAARYMSVS